MKSPVWFSVVVWACLAVVASGCGDDGGGGGDADAGPTGDGGPPGEPCTTAGASEEMPCGMCGTQTRFCTSSLIWEVGECAGEHGDCMAGTTMDVACGPSGTVSSRCSDECAWVADGDCSGPLWSCSEPLVAAAAEGTVSVTGDTSVGGPGPLDLGNCGLAIMDPAMRPAQIVVSYVVPGTGSRAISITTENEVTPENFDTMVQVRRGDCTVAPEVREGTCFDDGLPPAEPPPMVPDFRTLGAFTAMGGETLYFVVTGYGERVRMGVPHVSEGPFRLDITVGDPTPPELTAATVEVVAGMDGVPPMGRVSVTGMDAGGDATAVVLTLLDSAGTALDVNADGMVDALDDRRYLLPPTVMGMTAVMETVDAFGLAEDVMATGAARAAVRLVDAAGSSSAALTVDIDAVLTVGFGDACDAEHVCGAGLVCTAGSCAASPELMAACSGATALTWSGMPGTASSTGTLPAGAGTIARPRGCAGSGGVSLHRVTIPAGAFDLVATTANDGTEMTLDTVVWALSTCEDVDGGPAGACVDDMGMERRATLVVENATGTYTLGVGAFGPLPTASPYRLDLSLRPVLPTGSACDPTGAMNRCAAAPCPASAVCP